MDERIALAFNYGRRYGVEIELNAFDKRDFCKHPLRKGELPEGIHYVGNLITKVTGSPVSIHKWQHTHHNNEWVLKPDSSCGIEVCSPVSKGWHGLKNICRVIEAFGKDTHISADCRCSLHVHMDVSDMCSSDPLDGLRVRELSQMGSILAYWIKCESVFLDSVPYDRKQNRYCQCIGFNEIFDHDGNYSPKHIISVLGDQKYYSLNTFHLVHGRRPTIEFRIVENEGCRNPYLVKNWIRLLIHFAEVAKRHPYPDKYIPKNRWSGLLWLDPEDVMSFLGFTGTCELSKGLEQTRNWFLARLLKNMKSSSRGLWSDMSRSIAIGQVERIVTNLGLIDNIDDWLYSNTEDKLYSKEYQN